MKNEYNNILFLSELKEKEINKMINLLYNKLNNKNNNLVYPLF